RNGTARGIRLFKRVNFRRLERELPVLPPALALDLERGVLSRLERRDRIRVRAQEGLIVAQPQPRRLDAQLDAPARKFLAQRQQLVRGDRVEAKLIEEAQQPRLAVAKVGGLTMSIPHLDRPADELIAARPFHPVDT